MSKTTDAQAERGQLNEPYSYVDIEVILEQAREQGWEGLDVAWEDAAQHLHECGLQHFYPERT